MYVGSGGTAPKMNGKLQNPTILPLQKAPPAPIGQEAEWTIVTMDVMVKRKISLLDKN
jgi:hypothetical protein